jgi:phenylpropionate dioxygenase-like ring-hydroxylating dioxygenase large terminal subunit
MERIWSRAWIYIGHESQVKNPGDYTSCNINHRVPVIMVRDRSGTVRVLHNRCAHKGAKLVECDAGNVRAFRCCYHGWTFATDGTLLKIPNEKGYEGTGFDRDNPIWNLQTVARHASYRGFVFASLDANAPDLTD